ISSSPASAPPSSPTVGAAVREVPKPPTAAPSTAPPHSTLQRAKMTAPAGPGQAEADPWTAEDWAGYYGEKAAIAEYDHGLPRAQAEARAHACCVAEWLWRNPTSSPPGRCLTCGSPDRTNDPLLAYGITNTHPNSVTWLHRD